MSPSQPFIEFGNSLQNEFVQEWLAENKKVFGYYCANMPEEIIHAAGFLPFRIRGTGNTDFLLSDAILSRFNCTFVRSTLNLALKGQYDFLSGAVVANTCDHIRRMFDIWIRKVPKAMGSTPEINLFFLSFPHVFSEDGRNWVSQELETFRKQFAQKYNVPITDESLAASIEVYTKNQELMTQLSNLRKEVKPKITGTEFFQIAIANSAVRKEFANKQLENIIAGYKLKVNQNQKPARARLMLVGSSIDTPEFVAMCEHAGGQIVTDTICTGARSFIDTPVWNPTTTPGKTPMDKIIQRLYNRTFCPRMMNAYKNRSEIVMKEIQQAKVDGVILQRIEFCDLHGCENSLYEHNLEKELNVPTLNLDREYFLGDTGRIRTRVEAFLEKIEARKHG